MISAIILAAGTSSRFQRTKQLLELEGKPLVQHVVDAASAASLDEILVVVGHEATVVAASLHLPPGGRTVPNPDYRDGQSTSLHRGLAAADPSSEAAVVLLADQPGIRPETIRALCERFAATRGRIVRARFHDGPGPALLSREIWAEASHLHGDTGARELMAAHPDWVDEVVIDAAAPPDVDTPGDWEAVRQGG